MVLYLKIVKSAFYGIFKVQNIMAQLRINSLWTYDLCAQTLLSRTQKKKIPDYTNFLSGR